MKNLRLFSILLILGLALISCEEENPAPQLGTLQIGSEEYSLTQGILRHWGELDEGRGNYIHILEVSSSQKTYFDGGSSSSTEGAIALNFELYSSDPEKITDGDYGYKMTYAPNTFILGTIDAHDESKTQLIKNGVLSFKNLDSGYELSYIGKTTAGDSVICEYKGDLTAIEQ